MSTPENKEKELILVQSALADDLGIRAENITRLSDVGDNSEAFAANVGDQSIIIKTIENDRGTYPVEIASLDLLRQHGIPVATPLGYKEKAKYLDRPILVQTAVPGTQMSRSEEASGSQKLHIAIGEMMKKIHQIKLPGFGKLEIRGDGLHGQSASWKESLLTFKAHGISYRDVTYLMDNGFINSTEAKKIESAFDEVVNADLPQASFLHNDIQGGHIFTDGEKITGLIDMGGVSAGDPRFDIAKTRYYFPKELWTAIDQGYGELSQDPLVDKYFLLVAARKVIYRHKKNFTDRIPKAVKILKDSLSQ